MEYRSLCISAPDMKLHRTFLPIIQKNLNFIKNISVIAIRNLKLAKAIVDRYNGRFFYDFDFSAFVFLNNIQDMEEQEEKRRNAVETVNRALNVWNIYEQHMHLSNWYMTSMLYQRELSMLNDFGVFCPRFINLRADYEANNKQYSDKGSVYITSSLFRRTVEHLKTGNRIPPVKERLTRDFERQESFYEYVQNTYQQIQNSSGVLPYSRIEKEIFTGLQKINPIVSEGEKADSANLQSERNENILTMTDIEINRSLDLWMQIYSDFSMLHNTLPEKQQISRIIWGLNQLIEEKQIFTELNKQLHIEIDKHNFENFEDEKLCFIGVIKNYQEKEDGKENLYKFENNRLENLIYKVSRYTNEEWQAFKEKMNGLEIHFKQLYELRTDIQNIAGSGGKNISLEDIRTVVSMNGSGSLRTWVQGYEDMVSRHYHVERAVEKYEEYKEKHGFEDFQSEKMFLIRCLKECRILDKKLFSEEKSRQQIDTVIESRDGRQIFKTLNVLKLTKEQVQFENISKQMLERIRRYDREQWDELAVQIHKNYPGIKEVSPENPEIHLLQDVVNLQMAVADMQKVVDQLQASGTETIVQKTNESIRRVFEEIQDIFNALARESHSVNVLEDYTVNHLERMIDELKRAQETTLRRQEIISNTAHGDADDRRLRILFAQSIELLECLREVRTEVEMNSRRDETQKKIRLSDILRQELSEDIADIIEDEVQSTPEIRAGNQFVFEMSQLEGRRIFLARLYREMMNERTAILTERTEKSLETAEKNVMEIFTEKGFRRLQHFDREQWEQFTEVLENLYSDIDRLEEEKQFYDENQMFVHAQYINNLDGRQWRNFKDVLKEKYSEKYSGNYDKQLNIFLRESRNVFLPPENSYIYRNYQNSNIDNRVNIRQIQQTAENVLRLGNETDGAFVPLQIVPLFDSGNAAMINVTRMENLQLPARARNTENTENTEVYIENRAEVMMALKQDNMQQKTQRMEVEKLSRKISDQEIQVEALTREQKELKKIIQSQNEELDESRSQGEQQEKQIMLRLEKELRMERIRRGME